MRRYGPHDLTDEVRCVINGVGGSATAHSDPDFPLLVLAPTITKLPDCSGRVLLTGSHGGTYTGELALGLGLRAVVFHDAGVGKEDAGVAALVLLDAVDVASATVDYRSARVGDCDDMLARGAISRSNSTAQRCGVVEGISVREAVRLLHQAVPGERVRVQAHESRSVLRPVGEGRALVLIDSAALVDAVADIGAVVVTGSHGGLVGGDPAMALRVNAAAAVYNDAGIGIEQAGIARLAALDERGIAAVTVAAATARIGDAMSSMGGVISAANATAVACGAEVGQPVAPVVLRWAVEVAALHR